MYAKQFTILNKEYFFVSSIFFATEKSFLRLKTTILIAMLQNKIKDMKKKSKWTQFLEHPQY